MNDALLIELAAVWELQAETGGDGLNKFAPAACETLRMCADALRMLADFSQRAKPHEPSVHAYWQRRALEAEAALARGMEARSGETERLDPEGATARPEGTRPEASGASQPQQPAPAVQPEPLTVALTDDDWQAIADDAGSIVWSRIRQAVDRRLDAITGGKA